MHNNIYRKVETHLDNKLGRWTRLLPWRHELSDHLQQLYENKLAAANDPQTAWENALEEFGDIDTIATELKRLHKPENICLRLITLLISIALLIWAVGQTRLLSTFIYIPAALLLISPLAIGVISLIFSNSLKPKDINRYCNFALCAGAVTGLFIMSLNFSTPSRIGTGAALAILSTLYAILFLDVDLKYLCLYILINTAAMMIILYSCFGPYYEILYFLLQSGHPLKLTIVAAAGLSAGWARWGTKRMPQYMLQIAVGVMVVYEVIMLQALSSPDQVFTNIVLGLLPLIAFPLLGKIMVNYSTPALP